MSDTSTTTEAIGKKDRSALIGFAFAVLGTVLFSMKSILVKMSYRVGVDPETLLAARYGLALPAYLMMGAYGLRQAAPARRTQLRPLILPAVLTGALGYWLSSYLDFLGLQHVTAQLERMVLFTYPLMVIGLGWLIFGRRPRGSAILAALASYAGLGVLFADHVGAGASYWTGVCLVFLSALTFAFYQLFAKPIIGKIGVPIATAAMMTGACVASFVPLAFVVRPPTENLTVQALALIALLAFGGTVLPSLFLNMALARISSQANASIGALGPVVTIALAAALLGERLAWGEAGGLVLVIAGVAWFTIVEARQGKP